MPDDDGTVPREHLSVLIQRYDNAVAVWEIVRNSV